MSDELAPKSKEPNKCCRRADNPLTSGYKHSHSCVIHSYDFHLNLTEMFPVLVPSFQTNFSSYVSSSNLAEEVSGAPSGEPRAIHFPSAADRQSGDVTDVTEALWVHGCLRVGGRVGFLCVCCLLLLSSQ